MTSSTTPPCKALPTADAARYLGVSVSLLRKMRSRAPEDPLGPGPAFIKLSRSLIVYPIAELDAWLDWPTTIAVLVFNGLTIFLCLSSAAPHVVTEMAPLAQMP